MMIRPAAILLAGSVVAAARSASPLHPTPPARAPVVGAARSSLPLPPTPPAHAPSEVLAPLPGGDLRTSELGTPTTEFSVRMFSLQEHGGGLAFIPGSAYPAPEDRKPVGTPGFTVSLPMR
jgi:hypothetical protein